MKLLSEILSSKVRAEVFRLLFGLNDSALHMRDIERQSGFAIGTIQGELRKLFRLDLVKKRKDGNRTYYWANKEHPLFFDIHNLVLKTNGLYEVLRNVLGDEKPIRYAFVFGSFAQSRELANSDIDLMVVGDLGLREVAKLLTGVEDKVLREVNPHVYTEKEFKRRIKVKDHFIRQLMAEPKIFIIGNEDEFKAMGSQRLAATTSG